MTSKDRKPMFLDPTDDQGRALFMRDIEGPFLMLNLLRFREWADYSSYPELAPEEPISGRDAYERYIEHTLPFLRDAGGELVLMGEGGQYFTGPTDERWDLVLVVRHQSLGALMRMAGDQTYTDGLGHRMAALRDARMLPIVESEPM